MLHETSDLELQLVDANARSLEDKINYIYVIMKGIVGGVASMSSNPMMRAMMRNMGVDLAQFEEQLKEISEL